MDQTNGGIDMANCSLGLPRNYDAWRTMSDEDYYAMQERSFAPEDEPERDEPEPDYNFE